MRWVLDTDVMVAALRSPAGASCQLLLAAVDGHFEMLLSVALFMEYEDILKRPAQLAASRLSVADIDVVLDQVAASGQGVELHYLWRPQLNDPGDEMVLETAINGQAELIVSFNTRDLRPGANRFGIPVEQPALALRRLRK